LCGTPKTRHFSAFLSHVSKIIFEKRLFRQFQRLALAAGDLDRLDPAGWDETTPFCRNQLQATRSAQKRADSHQLGERFVRRRFAIFEGGKAI